MNNLTLDNIKQQKNKIHDIAFRINFIKTILSEHKLEPLIEFDSTSKIVHNNHKDDVDCSDTRCILNKKVLDFNVILKSLGAKILYIKSGSTGHTFKAMTDYTDEMNSIDYAVKIVAYPKKESYGSMYNIKRPENTELLMLKKLSYFVVNKQSPHIILPIATFNTKIAPFVNNRIMEVINDDKYKKFYDKYNKGEFHSTVSVLISEWANGGDLLDYIRNNYETMSYKTWKVIFFQLLSVLAIIHAKYPGFRHNDLKANNILIHNIHVKTKDGKPTVYEYNINHVKYIIPKINIEIKIWDFDFACIPGLVENLKVDAEWTSKINIKPEQNQYYDIHYFFNTLTMKGFFPKFFESDKIPTKIKEFVQRVIPTKFKTGKGVTDRGRLLVDMEYTTPDKILKTDPLFEKFRVSS